MDFGNCFESLKVPVMICDRSWKIVTKNKACKQYLPIPRKSANIRKYIVTEDFFDNFENQDIIDLVTLRVTGDDYFKERTAVAVHYGDYSVLLFFSAFNYDMFREYGERCFKDGAANELSQLIDLLVKTNISDYDKYGSGEKIRRYIYNVIDNYSVILSMYESEKCICRFSRFFSFVQNEFSEILKKSGFRVSFKIYDEVDAAEQLYVDIRGYALIFVNMLLFVLSVAEKRTCEVEISVFGMRVNNFFSFIPKNKIEENGIDLKNRLIYDNPLEYLNFLPFEYLCSEFGGKVDCRKQPGERFDTVMDFYVELRDEKRFSSGAHYVPSVSTDVFFANLLSASGLL